MSPHFTPAQVPIPALLLLMVAGCGASDDGGTTGLDDEAQAVIDGPEQVVLDCRSQGSATYSAAQSTASIPIQAYRWMLNQTQLGHQVTQEIDFPGPGTHRVGLTIFDLQGNELDNTVLPVEATAPGIADCIEGVLVWGDPGHMWDGSASGLYRVVLPKGSQGTADVSWSLQQDGQVLEQLGTQMSQEVEFPGPGDYEVVAQVSADGAERRVSAPVGVRDGQPLSSPGVLAIWRVVRGKEESEFYEFRYMDAETGLVTPPAFTMPFEVAPDRVGACDDEHLVFGIPREDNDKTELYRMDHFGNDVEQLTFSEGRDSDPDIGPYIVYLDDTRTDFVNDELSYMDNVGSGYWRSSVDLGFAGQTPRFNPNGNVVALGDVRYPEGDDSSRRIRLFNAQTRNPQRYLHEGSLRELYGSDRQLGEGGVLAWHPGGDLLAYTVHGFEDPANIRLYTSRLDGSEVTEYPAARDNSGPLHFSPDGNSLIVVQFGDFFGGRLASLDLATGEVTTLSQTDVEVSDLAVGYCGTFEN